MPRQKRKAFSQIIIFAMLSLGIGIVAVSAFYASSFLALLGAVLIFWGVILLYVTPSRHMLLTLLNASDEATSANIERLIWELNLSEKGVYLPPQNLKNNESSLVFIPETPKTPLPTPEETNEKLLTNEKTGAFVTPPGSSLSRLFERELGFSFTKTDLNQIQNKLPKLLVEDLELAGNAEIQIQSNAVTMEITGSTLDEIYRQTDSHPKTHMQVGCLLSSAIACALAKATGKPVTIQNETRNQETKTTHIEYQIFEHQIFEHQIFECQIFEGKTMQLPPLAFSDACALNDRKVKAV